MSDGFRAMTEFWSSQGKAMLEAQEAAARSMAEGMRAMFTGQPPSAAAGAPAAAALTADLAQAGDALAKLWAAATTLSSELAQRLAGAASGSGEGVVNTVFERMLDPRQWMAGTGELDDVLTRMAEGPRLADLWDVERRYARVGSAWTALRRRTMEHQRTVLAAWLEAGRRYLAELARAGDAPLDRKRALQLWTEVANRQLLETQRSEPFLQSQREMIRASAELKLAQQELVEHFGKQYGFPTRTELDDVHRTVTTMRRELRRMRRALADARCDSAKEAADV